MTWKKFQDDAFRLTENEIESLIPEIVGQYRLAIRDINSELQKVYTTILDGVAKEDYHNVMLKYDRLTKLLDTVTKQYSGYSRKVGITTGEVGRIAMSNNFYRIQFTKEWLVPGLSFSIIPEDLIQTSVYGSIEAFKRYESSLKSKIFGSGGLYYPQAGTLSEFLASNRAKEIASIQREITQGLIRGNSYTKTSNNLKNIIGQFIKKDGEIHTTGAMANSMRIVRTESTRILNDASLANTNYARSEGVDVVRVWLATLDTKTRGSHAGLDSQPENKAGGWNIGGDFATAPGGFGLVKNNANCRCTTFESVNGSKPTIRRGRNPATGKNELFEYKDFDKWADGNGLKKNKFGEYYDPKNKPIKKVNPVKVKPTKTSPVKVKPEVKKIPDTFSLNTNKMKNNKLPKDIRLKGIDSKEYKEWIWENWADEAGGNSSVSSSVKKRIKPKKSKPVKKGKRPGNFGLDIEKVKNIKLPDKFKAQKYFGGKLDEEYNQWIWENWAQ